MKSGWEVKSLADICVKGSSNISQNQLETEFGVYPIYGASGFIKDISFFHQDKDYISIVKDGAGVGRITLLPAFSSIIGTLQYLMPKENIDIRFLYYLLSKIDFQKYKKGSTIPHVYFSDYSKETVYVPSFPEQKRIVSILDEAFLAIEKAKENAQKNLQNAKELFESYLQSIFANPGDDWVSANLEDYVTFIDYRGRTPNKVEEGMRLITAKNVKMGYLQENPREFVDPKIYSAWMTRGIPLKGDVLFTTEAPLANVAQLDSDEKVAFAQRIIILQPNRKVINQTFLKYLLLSNPLQKKILSLGTGATVVGIKASLLKKIEIKFPELSKQQSIIENLDSILGEMNKLKIVYQYKIEKLEELKKSIMRKAFNGELKTTSEIEI